MTTPDTPTPSPETIALAAEIERKRAVRKAKLQGVAPTGKPIVAMLDGVAYPLGTPLWRMWGSGPPRITRVGFIAGVCAGDPSKVIVGKEAATRAHYANAAKDQRVTLGGKQNRHARDLVWPSWELAREDARRVAQLRLTDQHVAMLAAARVLDGINALVDPTSPRG